MADTARVGHGDPPPSARAAQQRPVEETRPERMIKATVARSRSLMVGRGRKVVGYNEFTKEPIYAPICEIVDELTEIELPESEVLFQRERGYLIDPAKIATMKSEGPSFTEMRPPQGPTFQR